MEQEGQVVGVPGQAEGTRDVDAVGTTAKVGGDQGELGRLGMQPGPEPAVAADAVDGEDRFAGAGEDLIGQGAAGDRD